MPVRFCGPKCSACCAVISLWGIVMLALLGVFFWIRAPALAEDLPINETEWEHKNYTYDYIEGLYHQNAINCWIAAALYIVTFVLSVVMFKVNQRSSYVQS